MKKLAFYALYIFLCGNATAQTDSVHVWNKWCARKDTTLLFTAANNVIQIWCSGMKPDEIKLKSMDASLRIGKPEIKGDTLSVMAMPYPEKNKSKNMRLAVQNKKTGKTIKTINFTSDNVPPLVAYIGKIKATEADRKDILNQTTLTAAFPGSLYSYPYRIKGYVFKIQSSKGGATISANGIFLTKEVLQEIKDAPPGTVAEFSGITATCPECTPRKLDDIKIKIK